MFNCSRIRTWATKASSRGLIRLVVATTSFTFSQHTHAHSRWVVPSHSTLSGDKAEAIAIDFSISNDIFHADLPMGGTPLEAIAKGKNAANKPSSPKGPENPMAKMLNATTLNITAPDGSLHKDLPFVNLARKSASTFMLEQSGTYRIDVVQAPIDVTWFKNEKGEYGRIFGSHEAAAKSIPAKATDIEKWRIFNNIQAYVTRNDITQSALKATGHGLELSFGTHPSELFVNEKYQFSLQLNGKALGENIGVKITRHNTRFRNKRNSLEPTTNTKGTFEVIFEKAGLYLIEAELKVPSKDGPVSTMYSLFVTLEVNPE